MLARIATFAIDGVDPRHVSVEVDIRPGLPAFTIVGLGDAAVRESRDRVRAAILNSASSSRRPGSPPISPRRSCARSAPASTPRWRWPCSPRAARCRPARCSAYAVFGELSLGGELRDSPGALAVAEGARRAGLKRLIVPRERAREAALVEGLEVAGVSSLRGAAADALRVAGCRRCRRGRLTSCRPTPPSPTWPTCAATPRRSWPSRSPPRAGTTCCSRARPAPARRCWPAGCPRSCRR